jgi:uncharacterized membrane protein YtjA (UPF0391 family)
LGSRLRAFFIFPRRRISGPLTEESTMLRWAFAFFVLALIAALFGFGGIAAASAGIAKVLFFLFLIVFVVTLVVGLVTGRKISEM